MTESLLSRVPCFWNGKASILTRTGSPWRTKPTSSAAICSSTSITSPSGTRVRIGSASFATEPTERLLISSTVAS